MVDVVGSGSLHYFKDNLWWPVGVPREPLKGQLWAWWDASDTATITESSGAVSQWDDKSGNNRHLLQATAANQPTTGSATLNGLNVISNDGGDFMQTTATSAFAQSFTMIIAWQHIAENGIIVNFPVAGGGYSGVFQNNSTGGLSEGVTLQLLRNNTVVATTDNRLQFYNRVATKKNITTLTGIETTGVPVRPLAYTSADFIPQAYMAEILFYNRALHISEIELMEAYLSTKWGISI